MLGFDWRTLNLLVAIEEQSPNIAEGVYLDREEIDIGAGDQVSTILKPAARGKKWVISRKRTCYWRSLFFSAC